MMKGLDELELEGFIQLSRCKLFGRLRPQCDVLPETYSVSFSQSGYDANPLHDVMVLDEIINQHFLIDNLHSRVCTDCACKLSR
jgi:hypothetical protein